MQLFKIKETVYAEFKMVDGSSKNLRIKYPLSHEN